jgi:DNA repair protein RecO (recombination protein O)
MRRLSERDDLDLVLRFFEMSLLIRLGYQPQVTQCVTCGRGLAEEGSSWVPSAGGIVCPRCRPEEVSLRALSVRALTALRMLQTEDFGEAARTRIDPGAGEEVERLLRDAVYYALDRDIRSAAFLDAVRLPAPTRPARIRGAGSPSRTQV